MKVTLPPYRVWPVIPREYYSFFQQLAQAADVANTIDLGDIDRRLTLVESEADEGSSGNIQGSASVQTEGLLPGFVYVTLVGDSDTPGNTQYYGTNGSGVRGWYAVADAIASTTDVTLDVGADGVTTIGLADLADTGTGAALVKITRDAKGRLSGTSAATTSDLTEGTNLYFTDVRADA